MNFNWLQGTLLIFQKVYYNPLYDQLVFVLVETDNENIIKSIIKHGTSVRLIIIDCNDIVFDH